MRSGLCVLLVSILIVFDIVRASDEADKIGEIVKDIREVLTGAREGVPADFLETGVKDLASDIKDVIDASGVKITKEQAQIVINQIATALNFGAEDIKNPLKFQINSMAKAFRLLKGMADKLEEIQNSGSTENLYETLVATEATCFAIAEAVENIDDVIKVVEEMGGGENAVEEAKDARRKWCVGWNRRALLHPTRDVNKRKWCVGSERAVRRTALEAQDENADKRKWCVGWDKRDLDINKRRWCVGWENKNRSKKRRSLAAAGEESPVKRKWCVGWDQRSVGDMAKRRWCVGWERRSVVVSDSPQ